MIYVSRDWTEGELLDHFRFSAEDIISDDPDVLYRGELITVESGGIQQYVRQQSVKPAPQSYSGLAEIQGDPYIITPAEIKKLF